MSQQEITNVKWSGKEEEEWGEIREKFEMNHVSDRNPQSCAIQWMYLVLQEASGFYIRSALSELKRDISIDISGR